MTRQEILARLQSESLKLPFKLQSMIARYIQAVNEGPHTPSKLMALGAKLLNDTIKRADGGDVETQRAMVRDGVNAMYAATAAELFGCAAEAFKEIGT